MLSLFHFGLKTGAGLILGPSESPGDLAEEFDSLDDHWKIFRKRRDVRLPVDVRLPLVAAATKREESPPPLAIGGRSLPNAALIGAYDWMLDRFMPPALLIDDRHHLLHVSSGAERFLRVRRGRPTGNALELLDDDLRNAVIGALQRVANRGESVCFDGLRNVTNSGEETLRVTIEPVANKRSAQGQFLI